MKEIVSDILKQEREWVSTEDRYPDPNEIVVIRLYLDPSIRIRDEDDDYIYPVEDIKIGTWDGEKWSVLGPHPKYDYSPLSHMDVLKQDTVVTHWAIPETEPNEVLKWNTRLNRIREYRELNLIVDRENEEDVYKALTWGRSLLAMSREFYEKDSDIRKYYEILCDIQQTIDARI